MEHSAGTIVSDGYGRYLVVQGRDGHWGFPKGHVEEGETPLQAAVRETTEEVGLHVRIVGEESATIAYRVPAGPKQVTFFLAETASTRIVMNDELVAYAWLAAEQVPQRLAFPETRDAFLKLVQRRL